MREIAPDQDQFWFDTSGRVALTGEPARFENYSTPLGRWWDVYAFRISGPRRIAVLFRDITDQKRAEARLHESEARLAFLDRSAPRRRRSADADAVLATTTRLLGEHLNLSVCAYADMDEDEGRLHHPRRLGGTGVKEHRRALQAWPTSASWQ